MIEIDKKVIEVAKKHLTFTSQGVFDNEKYKFTINNDKLLENEFNKDLIIKKITKIKPQLSTTGGTSDARFIRKIAPCLEFGLVGKTMHKVDEAVSISDLKKLTKIYYNILECYFK